MTRVLRIAPVAAVLAVALAAPTALADDQETAAPPNQFVKPDVTIDQGGKLTFQNNDTVEHDVTARDAAPDGQPLFKSPLTSTGQSSTVKGTEYLTHGDYAFICSIHPNMTGTLHVTSSGTAVPRPSSGGGGGGGGGSSSSGGGGSSTHPRVALKLLDTRLSAVRRRGALRTRVTVGEAATIKLTARAGRTALAAATVKFTKAGARSVSLKLTSAGRRAVRHGKRLAVSLSARATDGSGHAVSAKATRTLRR
jgi:plastocyanin